MITRADIPDCEITVHMTPATEVSGDYYDVINTGGMAGNGLKSDKLETLQYFLNLKSYKPKLVILGCNF